MKRFLSIAMLLFLVFIPDALSADIKMLVGNDGSNGNVPSCKISISGEIVAGDAEKLEKLISDNAFDIFFTNFVELNSGGGSVGEAIKISDLINRHRFGALVNNGDVCASSCALIYLTAPLRISSGDVLLHRPYFDLSSIDLMEMDKYESRQQAAILYLREFLTSRGIPGSIVDRMMSLPSNSAYRLTLSDSALLGPMSPMLEEFSIKQCGLNNSELIKSVVEMNDVNVNVGCVLYEAAAQFRFYSYVNNYGWDEFDKVSSFFKAKRSQGQSFSVPCGD